MDKVFLILALVALVGVVGSLFGGLLAMAKGTPKDHQTSQKMMQLRVICQGAVIVCLFLAYVAKH